MIKYEKDIVLLRKVIQAKQKADDLAKAEARHHREWKRRVLRQGPWDESEDPLPLTGAPALPMPVTIRYVFLGRWCGRLAPTLHSRCENGLLTAELVIRRAWLHSLNT